MERCLHALGIGRLAAFQEPESELRRDAQPGYCRRADHELLKFVSKHRVQLQTDQFALKFSQTGRLHVKNG